MWLSDETFRSVVSATPLVSIDLVLENAAGDILLGQRRNRPAQGFWFVPGGRILKNETLDAAFRRLTLMELDYIFERGTTRWLGGNTSTPIACLVRQIIAQKVNGPTRTMWY